jgi:hypothetical protein
MRRERLHLAGGDWARYFAPVAICAYVGAICVALMITAAFLTNRYQGVAISAAGFFGLLMSCGLGAVLLITQLRELRFVALHPPMATHDQYLRVMALAQQQGWRITGEQPDRRLEVRTEGSVLDAGELIVVQFRGDEALVACICDPSIGFSLVGQRRCKQNRELVSLALAA